jgi:hypothetical protein
MKRSDEKLLVFSYWFLEKKPKTNNQQPKNPQLMTFITRPFTFIPSNGVHPHLE